jgi:hypothetical protein
MSLKGLEEPYLGRIVVTTIKKVFHCLNFLTPEAAGIRGHTRFECLFLCPDSPINDLKYCFLGFGGQQGKLEDFTGILDSRSPWEGNPVSLASHIGGGKLHLLVEKMPL